MCTTINDLWQVREYDATRDAETLRTWAAARGVPVVPETLSPVAVVVENDGDPLAMAWLFLCVGAPVGIMDKCLIRPALPLAMAKAAARHCVDSLKAVASAHGLQALYTFVPRGIARVLVKEGWHVAANGLTALTIQP